MNDLYDPDRAPGEEVTRRNVLSIRDYTVATRTMVRDQNLRVDALERQVMMLASQVDELRVQVAIARGLALNGGPTSGHLD